MKRLNQTGSHVVALAVGLLVVGVVGFAGYTVSQHQEDSSVKSTATASDTINPTGELNIDDKTLDDSSSQLDSSLDDSSLDADLNDML